MGWWLVFFGGFRVVGLFGLGCWEVCFGDLAFLSGFVVCLFCFLSSLFVLFYLFFSPLQFGLFSSDLFLLPGGSRFLPAHTWVAAGWPRSDRRRSGPGLSGGRRWGRGAGPPGGARGRGGRRWRVGGSRAVPPGLEEAAAAAQVRSVSALSRGKRGPAPCRVPAWPVAGPGAGFTGTARPGPGRRVGGCASRRAGGAAPPGGRTGASCAVSSRVLRVG